MFHPLHHISPQELPHQFTYPFHYQAHPLCIVAAKELQAHINKWNTPEDRSGKMFGVLLVKDNENKIGYLCAYSGNLTPEMDKSLFVPPIYNLQDSDGFFAKGESDLGAIKLQIQQLEDAPLLRQLKDDLNWLKVDIENKTTQEKTRIKHNKQARKQKRIEAKEQANTDNSLEKKLTQESQHEKAEFKRKKAEWRSEILLLEQRIKEQASPIAALKEKRKQQSNDLQLRIFDQYQLLNNEGVVKGLRTIFRESRNEQPPAGAGDCAAPRLLQYAYLHQLAPLAMAEFWWGASPKSQIRKQGNFYPSCRGKCEPILGHMLQGLNVEDNPVEKHQQLAVEYIYEDDTILVVNKPSGMLSAPGKSNQTTVIQSIRHTHAEANSYFVAHRLDMATSGIMIIAKDAKSYKNLQAQFESRQVKKRYEAILCGVLSEDSGTINLPLRVDLDNRPQQLVCDDYGKPASTIWKVISRSNNETRIAFYPITGRTHQLRVHASHPSGLNAAIKGDELYGTPSDRLYLHAASITFTHPLSNKTVHFSTPPSF